MALSATIYNFETELADIDRGVYQSLALRMARHPSETPEFMLTRLLAYCLEYDRRNRIHRRRLGGRRSGCAGARHDRPRHRVDRSGDARRAAAPSRQQAGRPSRCVHPSECRESARRAEWKAGAPRREIPVYEFGTGFVDDVASVLQRRDKISVSITERQLYLDVSGTDIQYDGCRTQIRLAPAFEFVILR